MDQSSDIHASIPDTPLAAILVVEDETLVRLMTADYLRDCGYLVLEAANADDAIALLLAPQTPIDLVFSDVHMPGAMNGLDLARWIRVNRPGLPVIITSGVTQTAALSEKLCSLAPIEVKPYHVAAIERRMRMALAA